MSVETSSSTAEAGKNQVNSPHCPQRFSKKKKNWWKLLWFSSVLWDWLSPDSNPDISLCTCDPQAYSFCLSTKRRHMTSSLKNSCCLILQLRWLVNTFLWFCCFLNSFFFCGVLWNMVRCFWSYWAEILQMLKECLKLTWFLNSRRCGKYKT